MWQYVPKTIHIDTGAAWWQACFIIMDNLFSLFSHGVRQWQFVDVTSSMSLRQSQLDEGNRSLALAYPLANVIVSKHKRRKMLWNHCVVKPNGYDDGPTLKKNTTMTLNEATTEDITVGTLVVDDHQSMIKRISYHLFSCRTVYNLDWLCHYRVKRSLFVFPGSVILAYKGASLKMVSIRKIYSV